MNIYEEAMKYPNKLASDEFIESALKDVESDILMVEQKFHVKLLGDRNSFSFARKDWKNMVQSQVVYFVSSWKREIFKRYGLM